MVYIGRVLNMGTKIKHERVFLHELDGITIKITKVASNKYMWVQYRAFEDTLDIIKVECYTKDEIISMVGLFEPYGNIPTLELFEKFNNI